MSTFAKKAIDFHSQLDLQLADKEIGILNPFKDPQVLDGIGHFYHKYFNDQNPRTFLYGINPGRFGAGITGIAFTDPVNLQNDCGISNDWDKKHELSSQFIYQMIEAYGGSQKFYASFFMTAVSPLGFTKNGKNINYYDEKELQESLEPFIRQSLIEQLEFGAFRNKALCIGGGKNFKYLSRLNDELKIFDEIIPLDHPRFIMQYRRKFLPQYIGKYLDVLNQA